MIVFTTSPYSPVQSLYHYTGAEGEDNGSFFSERHPGSSWLAPPGIELGPYEQTGESTEVQYLWLVMPEVESFLPYKWALDHGRNPQSPQPPLSRKVFLQYRARDRVTLYP